MKKIFRFLLVATAIFGGFTACSEDELAPEMTFHKETISATVAEQIDPVGSKACVDINNLGNGFMGFLWQRYDSIAVFGKGGTRNSIFKSTSWDKVRQANFSGNVADGDKVWRAYYPYNPANEGRNYNELVGNIPAEQPFDHITGRLVADYKYGAPIADGSSQFNFRHMFSMLRFDIDATETNLEGEALESIELAITDANGNPRNINGSFTFNAENGEWSNVTNATNKIRMPWTSAPVLSKDKSYLGFMTLMPDVKAGDNIAVTIYTTDHKATFTAKCLVDFVKECVYNIPLILKKFVENDKFGYTETELPKFTGFKFEVSKNSGKLLNNQLVWNSGNPKFNSVSEHATTITYGESSNDITVTIPYLYDFNLAPTFTVPSGCTVTVNGVKQTSGATVVDFSKPVNYVVTNEAGDFRKYTVKVQNTGLPVVVIEQSSTGDFSKKYVGGVDIFGTNIGGTLVNEFVNFMIRGKDTEWVEDDKMTVYNADGTVNMATTTCGTRLRGNTTQRYKKKPFAIKLTSKQSVLGMPAHKRWVLLANCFDHSMIRNTVAFDIAHIIEAAWKNELPAEQAGIPWNVHGQNVELVFNGHHVGNYFLCEQIKIDGGRLDIKDTYEDVVKKQGSASFADCGYLFECDNNYDEDQKFKTSPLSIPFMFKDAVSDAIYSSVQTKVNGIANKINNKDASVYSDFDIYKAIDQFIIWELTMNREYLDPRSVYYYMNGNGKLSAGPVWDFDRATFQNVANVQNYSEQKSKRIKPYNKWICLNNITESSDMTSVFYPQLIKETTFQNALKERWAVLYPYLQLGAMAIEQYREPLRASFGCNNTMWPTDKAGIKKHKNDLDDWAGDEVIPDWDDIIDNLINVYNARLDGMNTLINNGTFQ